MNDEKVAKTKVDILKSVMNAESVQQQFKNALGENANSFVASVIDLYTGDESLQTCDPKAVVMEALKAAVLKLPIAKSLGFAYVLVFNISVQDENNKWIKVPTPTFVPGYKGYIQLAMRTGQYRIINADVVYEGEYRSKKKLSGEYDLSGDKISDKVIGYFAYFELLNGFSKAIYVTVEDMAKHAKKYSPVMKVKKEVTVESLVILANQEGGSGVGWLGNFEDMAMKTCLRILLSKYGYLSVEMMNAIEADNKVDYSTDNEKTKVPQVISIDDIQIPENKVENEEPGY